MSYLFASFTVGIWIGLALFGVLIIWFAVNLGSMQKKFIKIGTLKGLTADEITRLVAKAPKFIQYTEDGSVRVWAAFGYQITLLFDKDSVCLGVANESSI